MRAFFLLGMYLSGVAVLYSFNPSFWGLIQESPIGWLKAWQETMELFALPFVFLLFCWSKNSLFKWARLLWSFWVSSLSFILVWTASYQFPQISVFGLCFVAFTGILTLSLTLTTLFEISRGLKAKQKKLSEVLLATRSPRASVAIKNEGSAFQGVEGT